MDEIKRFKQIVAWMMKKEDITINDILNLAKMSKEWYSLITERGVKTEHISASVKVVVQNFNKKYYVDYLADKEIDKLDDDPDFVPGQDSDEKEDHLPDPNPAMVEPQIEDAEVEAKAVGELLYNETRSKRRIAERAQEKIFNEALQRLRDVTPDHMTFDIILKHR